MDNTSRGGYVKGKKVREKKQESTCKELEKEVKDRREDSLTKGIEKRPHTVGSGKFIGRNIVYVALSRISALGKRSAKRARFIEPMSYENMKNPFSEFIDKDGKKKPFSLCGEDYTFPPSGQSSLGTHAEARIISKAAREGKLSGGTLFLNVDWRNTDGNSKAPCKQCQEFICHTMNTCGTQIYMCTKDSEAVDMEDYCDEKSDEKKKGELRSKLERVLDVDMLKIAAASSPIRTISSTR